MHPLQPLPKMTASKPDASAVRIIVPILPGSCTASINNNLPPSLFVVLMDILLFYNGQKCLVIFSVSAISLCHRIIYMDNLNVIYRPK